MVKKDEIKKKVLLNDTDRKISEKAKMEAHFKDKLYRGFSIFIFNNKGELLMQKRSKDKSHSVDKWTNTCCSHPKVGERTPDAATRRLSEEMGISAELFPVFKFLYRTEIIPGIIENEYDHIFFGITDQPPVINTAEVAEYEYVNMQVLNDELVSKPDKYTEWLVTSFDCVMQFYRKINF